jgi:hypothetical protein
VSNFTEDKEEFRAWVQEGDTSELEALSTEIKATRNRLDRESLSSRYKKYAYNEVISMIGRKIKERG